MTSLLKLISVFFFTCLPAFSYSYNTDSLWQVWTDNNAHDTARAEAIQYYAWAKLYTNLDSAKYYGEVELKFARKHKLPRWVAKSHNTIGIVYLYKGEYDSSLTHLQKALQYRIAMGNKADIARSYGNIGLVYQEIANYPVAIDFFMKSLQLKEEINDSLGIANTCNNIGLLYSKTEDYEKEIVYQKRSLKIYRALEYKKGVAIVSSNLGTLSLILEDFENAKTYLNESVDKFIELDNQHGLASTYLSLSKLYLDKNYTPENLNQDKKYQFAYDYAVKSLKLFEVLQEPRGMMTANHQLAKYHNQINELTKGMTYAKKAIEIGQKHRLMNELKDVYLTTSTLAEKLGDYRTAFKHHKDFAALKDSLLGEKSNKELYRNEIRFQFEKQAAEDSIKRVKDAEIAASKIEAQENLLSKERSINYLSALAIIILIVSGTLLFRRYKITKQQKGIIQDQKQEVAQQHEEILDSIHYAKRLQNAILPQQKTISDNFENSFIIFLPKDVVSGDFYWFEKVGNLKFIAVADCTGHGVPGAMVSMVCHNALNKAVVEEKRIDPADILNRTRQLVIENFEKSQDNVQDGMDISLCVFESNNNHLSRLKWAGANNPLWIVRKGGFNKDQFQHIKTQQKGEHELIEFKADKQAIGKSENQKAFTTHTIELLKEDSIYLFSDGFADQFGGEDGKKLKTKNFKKLLLKLQNVEMNKQGAELEQNFNSWKGNTEQLDDVCVLGMRV